MKASYMSRLFLLASALILAEFSFAKEINLLEQPNNGAKVIGKVDLSAGVIPIYTPQGNEWTKVADPRNGNVGWVKAIDLKSDKGSAVTFTQKIINDGNAPYTYQVYEFGRPEKISDAELQAKIQRLQNEHRAAQESMQRAVGNMMNELNAIYQTNWHMMHNAGFPMIMPVIVVPGQGTPKAGQPAAQPNTKPSSTGTVQPQTKPGVNIQPTEKPAQANAALPQAVTQPASPPAKPNVP